MKIHFTTFGCKVNTYETAAMAEQFLALGHERTDTTADADIAVINSCTVTAGGDKKVRQFLRRVKREHPRCVTVLCGCFPQAYPDDAAAFSEADIVTGTGNRNDVPGLVEAFLKKEKRVVKEALKAGEYDLIIGTHALFSNDVEYNNLALVVTDEQHRFGVGQRSALIGKGKKPHVLVM